MDLFILFVLLLYFGGEHKSLGRSRFESRLNFVRVSSSASHEFYDVNPSMDKGCGDSPLQMCKGCKEGSVPRDTGLVVSLVIGILGAARRNAGVSISIDAGVLPGSLGLEHRESDTGFAYRGPKIFCLSR